MCHILILLQVPPHTGKKTVLVTGGAGFIGSWVADSLLARGDEVVIVDEVSYTPYALNLAPLIHPTLLEGVVTRDDNE